MPKMFVSKKQIWHTEWGQEPIRELDESESGQVVFLKLKLAYSDAYVELQWDGHHNVI